MDTSNAASANSADIVDKSFHASEMDAFSPEATNKTYRDVIH
jgi:hypothetical protein